MFKALFGKPAVASAPAGADADTDAGAAARAFIAEGNRLEDAGQVQEAVDRYRKAVDTAPGLVAAHLNLGIGLAALGDAAGAKAAYEAALAIEPGHAFANYNFARLAQENDRPLALTLVRRALETKADFPEAQVLLSAILEEMGDGEDALAALDAALALRPDFTGARVNRALILSRLSRDDEAIDEGRRALQDDPSNLVLLDRLVTLLARQRMPEEALATARAAITHHPDRLELRSRELFLRNYGEQEQLAALFADHREFGARLEAAHPARFTFAPRGPRTARRLRIGYVSSDFYGHPVAIFMLPVLERRDRKRFEVFCYSTGWRNDDVTAKVKALSDGWVDAAGLSNEELADRIHADGIDVLVDLAGHSGTQRLAVFAQRPAPVQVSWLGYLQTTGLSRMDYRLTDARSSPPETAASLHTEQLVPLQGGQWCYRPLVDVAPVAVAPFLDNGHVTFASFAQAPKISRDMCRRWSRILQALPASRLLVADLSSGRRRAFVEQAFQEFGADRSRIRFLPRLDIAQYFAAFNQVDIVLDTYPYGGGTTTLDALWMSVPVATAMGEAPMSRSAASLLLELGLDDWVAPRIEDYEAMVIARARDGDALSKLRVTLRQRLQASALMDEPGFTARMEAAFDRMWAERGV